MNFEIKLTKSGNPAKPGKEPVKPDQPCEPQKIIKEYRSVNIYSYQTIEEIISKCPKDIPLSDIRINAYCDDYEDCSVDIYVDYPVQCENKNYERDVLVYEKLVLDYSVKLEEYECRYAKWKAQKDVYDAWLSSEDVKNKNKEIEQLKKEIEKKQKELDRINFSLK